MEHHTNLPRPVSLAFTELAMPRTWNILVVLIVVSATGCGRGAEDAPKEASNKNKKDEYSIVLKRTALDTPVQNEKTIDETVEIMQPGLAGGKGKRKTGRRHEIKNYTDTVFEVAQSPQGDVPIRLRRVYEKAVLKHKDKDETLAYQGKALQIRWNKGSCNITAEDGSDLSLDELHALHMELKSESGTDLPDELLFPAHAVELNAPWQIPLDRFADYLQKSTLVVDVPKSTAMAKLVKVEKRDGHLFGKMDLNLHLVATAMQGHALGPGASLKANLTVEACIDGSLVFLSIEGTYEGAFPAADNRGVSTRITRKVSLKQAEVPR